MPTASSPIARLPRFRRVATPRSFELTQRDCIIVAAVARFRFLSSEQIARFAGGSQQQIQRRLQLLFQGRAKSAAAQRRTLDGTLSSAGYNSKPDFAGIKLLVPLSMVLSHYGLLQDLKPLGSQLAGCCPIHGGSNPRQFVVHLVNNSWHCFGDCQRGGGVLDLVALRESVPLAEAAQLIADWFALSPSPRPKRPQQQRTPAMTSRPSHRAYVVEDAEGDQTEQKGFWTRVGSAWPHKDGKGLNIVLSALPVNGRIVLREYTEDDQKADDNKRKTAKK